MSPSLHGEWYVYCCVAGDGVPPGLTPGGAFGEVEGLTLILPRDQARLAGLSFQFECALVTLYVHSALDAVGFMALVIGALAKERIPCNVVAAYYHDHLLVPFEQRERVMQVLHDLGDAG